jgi:site-specific DNA-methyltransferase (adenine-specific)
MADFLPLPDKQYRVIYADPPWAYRQAGATAKSRGNAVKHYHTMETAEICAMPVQSICDAGGTACFMWATFPNVTEAIKVLQAWGFTYKTAAFVWVKKNAKSGGNFWGMGAYTRANAEVCLLGVTPGFKAGVMVQSHRVHQIIEAPFEGHSKKPDETRRRIVELLGDVPRIELFARQRAEGWDAWGNEAPAE